MYLMKHKNQMIIPYVWWRKCGSLSSLSLGKLLKSATMLVLCSCSDPIFPFVWYYEKDIQSWHSTTYAFSQYELLLRSWRNSYGKLCLSREACIEKFGIFAESLNKPAKISLHMCCLFKILFISRLLFEYDVTKKWRRIFPSTFHCVLEP